MSQLKLRRRRIKQIIEKSPGGPGLSH